MRIEVPLGDIMVQAFILASSRTDKRIIARCPISLMGLSCKPKPLNLHVPRDTVEIAVTALTYDNGA